MNHKSILIAKSLDSDDGAMAEWVFMPVFLGGVAI